MALSLEVVLTVCQLAHPSVCMDTRPTRDVFDSFQSCSLIGLEAIAPRYIGAHPEMSLRAVMCEPVGADT